eukprot:gene2773-5462_t
MRSSFAVVGIFLSLAIKNFSFNTFPRVFTRSRQHMKMSDSTEESVDPRSFFYSQKSFSNIGVTPTMASVLNSLSLERPSKIQALSYSSILEGKHCIVADQTGSGKTLAYLMPIMQRVMELIRNGTVPSVPSRSPYVVVITPTTELAMQVAKVAKTMANVLKFRTACITSVSDMDSEQRRLRLGVELLVSTPGRLLALLQRDELSLRDVHAVILDEADVLFSDETFPLQPIGAACPMSAQFIFTTATLPDAITKQILSEFPTAVLLKGPGLHRIAATVEEVLVDCSGPPTQKRTLEEAFENKRLALLKALEGDGLGGGSGGSGSGPSQRTIIFCNTIDQCRRVENVLQRADRQEEVRKVLSYHAAIDADTREKNFEEFCRPLLQTPVVLICTDRASRGIDFNKSPVDHVVLFDFPAEPSEYVRRVGRTGRAGRRGKVTVLVYGKQ